MVIIIKGRLKKGNNHLQILVTRAPLFFIFLELQKICNPKVLIIVLRLSIQTKLQKEDKVYIQKLHRK